MMNPLEALDAREAALRAQIPRYGYFEERQPQVEAAGLPAQWSQIIDEYAELLRDPVCGIEALRRAVFLVWYSYNEPWQLTGIRNVNPSSELEVLLRLEDELRSSEPDLELRSMLNAYGPSLPFDLHPELKATATFLKSTTGTCYAHVPLPTLETRGEMGAYWLSRNDLPNKPLQPPSGA